tara:strand:+ start:2486 stop:2695 length:210 start_codon:yes stop_codon:yes gene_type:complete
MFKVNNYRFTIDFDVSVLAKDIEQARDWINKKYYIREADVCNFVNIPVDNVSIYPTADTRELMEEMGEL